VPERMLVERARNRDTDAVGELYVLHRDAVIRYLRRIVGNDHDADDLAAETFLKTFQTIERFRPQGVPFAAWVYRIARNVAVDHFRARARAQALSEMLEPRSASASAEDEALAAIGHRRMLATVHQLSAGQRDVLVLRFVHSLSTCEAARILGKSEGSVKALQHRAIETLRREVDAQRSALASR
jgi:RNA polymerase sigma-70 factor (ECF subfamily)